MTASAEPALLMRLLISAGLKAFASNDDLFDGIDRDEMAESIDEVRGIMR